MKRRSSWRKWLRRALAACLVLVAARILLWLALPGLVELGARSLGLTSTYGSARLSLSSGLFVIDELELRPRGPDAEHVPPALVVDYLLVDVAMFALLRGDLRVQRAELDGAQVRFERDADGVLDWAARLPPADDEASPPPESAPAGPLDLALPFEIVALRIHGATFHLVDRTVSPAFEAHVEADLSVSDVGSSVTPATLRLDVNAPGLLEHARVEALAAAAGATGNARCELEITNLALEPLRALLAKCAIAPDGERLSARATIAVRARPVPEDTRACALEAEIVDVHAEVDREVRASLGHATLAFAALAPGVVRGVRFVMGDGELAIARRETGELALAGLRFGAAPAQASAPSAPAPALDTEPAPSAPLPVDIAGIDIQALALHWRDETTTPHAVIDARLVHLTMNAWDPFHAGPPALLSFDVSAPGACGDVHGVFELGGGMPHLRVKGAVDGERANLASAQPYLAAAGLAPELDGGSWHAELDAQLGFRVGGGLHVRGTLGPVSLSSGGELAALDKVTLDGLTLEPGKVDVARLAIDGLRVNARRSSDGAVHVAGLRVLDAPRADAKPAAPARAPTAPVFAPAAPASAPSAPASAPPHAAVPARFDFGEIELAGVQLRFVDETRGGAVFDTQGTALTIQNLGFGGVRGRDPQQHGRVRGRLVVAPVLGELTLEGELIGKPGPIDLDTQLTFRGKALDVRPLAPYLAALGIEPELAAGAFRVQVDTHITTEGETTSTRLQVRDLELVDGEKSLLQLDRVGGTVSGDTGRTSFAQLDLALGGIDVTRELDGSVRVLGLHLGVPQRAADLAADALAAHAFTADAPLGAATPLGAQLAALFAWPALEFGDARVTARIGWHDRAVTPPVDWDVRSKLELHQLSIGPGARTSGIDAELSIAGVLGSAKLHAEGELDPHALRVSGALDVQGLNGGALSTYLPPGQHCDLESGVLTGAFEVTSAHSSPQVWSFGATLRDVRAGEKGAEPFFALAEAHVSVPAVAVDAEHGDVVEIDRVMVRGLAARLRRSADGVWHVGGTASGAPHVAEAAPATGGTGARVPAEVSAEADALANAAPVLTTPPPTVNVRELSLELAELRVDDETRGADAKPLVVSATLANAAPFTLSAPARSETAPLELQLTADIAPIGKLDVRLRAAPLAEHMTFDIAGELAHLSGAGLVEFSPALAEKIDGAASMTDGVARLHVTGELRGAKRGAGLRGLALGFGAQIGVTTLELLDAPNGRRVAGIDSITVDVDRVDPNSGDVRVKSIEITRPFARFERRADGLHAFGLVFRKMNRADVPAQPPAAPPPAENVAAAPAEPMRAAPIDAEARRSSGARGPVVSIDQVLVGGLDIELRDETVTPPRALVFDGLDAEVRRLTSRARTENVPITFNAFISAGDVELPVREVSSSLLAGGMKATGRLLTGGSDEKRFERRPFFDEIAIHGRIALFPLPTGWVNVDISALELGPFSPFVAESGVELGDGVLDESVRVRMLGANGLSIDSHSSFSHLRVSEAPDGPISRYLRLPMPLDAVLYVLEDAEGRHNVPVDVHVADVTPTRSELTGAIVNATATVIARAIAASPFRVVGGITGMIGLGAEPEDPKAELERVTFAAGSVEIPPDAEQALVRAAAAVSADTDEVLVVKHVLSAADVERAELLANPPAADVLALVERLRQRRVELTRAHDRAAAEARVHWAVARTDDARALGAELRAVDDELGEIEAALDRAGALLRPNAETKRESRTRAAALRIANQRMLNVRSRLVELGVPEKRVELRRARFDATGERGELVLVPKRRS